MIFSRQLWWLSLIIGLLLVSGCASKLPRTVAVSGPDLEVVQERLSRFFEQSCVMAIDSDVRLGWRAYGRNETYPATLLATFPASVRFAIVDPLGRPLLLLITNGETFTLADNRRGEGYTGRLDSDFIRRYLPDSISGDDLFSWINGRIKLQGVQVLSARRAEDGELFWYELDYGDRLIHLVALDRDHLSRHLVLDEEDAIIFDVRYSGYAATSKQCGWPGKIVVTGEALAADFTLDFTRVYSFSALQQHLFQLQLPSHFTVHEVK